MIKKVILGAVILLGLMIVYNLLMQITNAVRSSERLSGAADKVYQLEIENRQLKSKLTQIQSPQFIEEQARNQLGLGKAGETIVVIAEEKLKQILEVSQSAQQVRLPNFLGWWRVFNP